MHLLARIIHEASMTMANVLAKDMGPAGCSKRLSSKAAAS